jgi:hypothetical protein
MLQNERRRAPQLTPAGDQKMADTIDLSPFTQ